VAGAWAVGPFVILVLVWYAVFAGGFVSRVWLPSPLATWQALWGTVTSGELIRDIGASIGRLAFAYVISAIMGIAVGLLVGIKRGLAEFVLPVINFLNGLSGLAFIPLAILWFGIGNPAVVFIVWNSVFFLVLYNTITGVQAVPKVYESAILTMGGGRWRLIRDVLIPGSLPNIVTGLRLGMGFAWRALIAAEIFAAPNGLGHLIYISSYYLQTPRILAGLIVIGIIWLATDKLIFVPVERRTIARWGLVVSR
jgi:NitT/TauT family transport system permease protein/taurine transport system permease protein